MGIKPGTYSLESTLGAALYRAGDPRAAIEQFDRAIAVDASKQGSVQDWCFLAMSHADLGNLEQAEAWMKKARAAPPHADWQGRVEIGLLLDEAGKHLREARKNTKETPRPSTPAEAERALP